MNTLIVKYLCYLTCLAIFLFTATISIQSSVAVPFWDQWEFIDTLDKFYSKQLKLIDLLALHHEHRLFFPRIIMLTLAYVSHWNILYEQLTNILLCLAIFLAFVTLTKHSNDHFEPLLLPPIAILIFSLCQKDNFLFGWQIAIFLNVLTILLAIRALSVYGHRPKGLILGVLFGVIATLSFANGLLIWPLGFITLFFVSQHRVITLPIWGAISAIVIGLYMTNFSRHPADPEIIYDLSKAPLYLVYSFAYLGAPLFDHKLVLSVFAGAIGCALMISSLIILYRNQVALNKVIPFVILCFYSSASALMSGIGRLGIGVHQSLSSRYSTIALLFWVSIVALLFLCVKSNSSKIVKVTCPAVITLISILSLNSSARYIDEYKRTSDSLNQGRLALLTQTDDVVDLHTICWSNEFALNQTKILKKYHLSVFRK